jgi:integrase
MPGLTSSQSQKRLGHKKPDVTLRVYSHLFRNDDSKAAEAINAMTGLVVS